MCNTISCEYLFAKKLREIEEMNSFYDYFSWLKRTYKDNIMFEYDKQKYTGKYFFKIVSVVNAYLSYKLKNIKKGSWIGIRLKNHPFYVAVLWGTLKSGFNVILVDNNISPRSHSELINKSKMSVIITDDNTGWDSDITTLFLDDILAFDGDIKIDSDFIATNIALCSSGTEGNMKISVYNEVDFLEAVKKSILGIKSAFDMADTMCDDDSVLISPPFFHIFGILCLFVYISVGITVFINKDNSLSDFMSNISNKNIRFAAHVPAILDAMFKFMEGKYKKTDSHSLKKSLGKRLKFFIGAGVSANKRIRKILNEMDILYIDCYGSTETGIISANNMICKRADTDIKVFKEGKFLSKGYGEIMVGGKGVRSAVLYDGALIVPEKKYVDTGDIGEIQGDSVFIKGRNNDIIIGQNGLNIIPQEIENYFDFLNDYRYRYTVLGIDDSPALVVYVGPTSLAPHLRKELVNMIVQRNREIDLAKRIVAVYLTLFDFPLTPSMKIKKVALLEQLIDSERCERIILVNKNHLNSPNICTKSDILNNLKTFFSEHLNISFDVIKDNALIIEELGTDSVVLAELFVYINKKYGIKLSKDFILKSSLNISDIANKIFEETHIL